LEDNPTLEEQVFHEYFEPLIPEPAGTWWNPNSDSYVIWMGQPHGMRAFGTIHSFEFKHLYRGNNFAFAKMLAEKVQEVHDRYLDIWWAY
jgi:hypothetical protein